MSSSLCHGFPFIAHEILATRNKKMFKTNAKVSEEASSTLMTVRKKGDVS